MDHKMRNSVKNFKQFLNENNEIPYEDYLYDIANHINDVIEYYDETEVKPLKIYLFGSRIKGNNREDSDLDALFLYEGSLRSKYLQDALNVDSNMDVDINIDISPVNIDEEYFLDKFYKDYDISKLPTYEF